MMESTDISIDGISGQSTLTDFYPFRKASAHRCSKPGKDGVPRHSPPPAASDAVRAAAPAEVCDIELPSDSGRGRPHLQSLLWRLEKA